MFWLYFTYLTLFPGHCFPKFFDVETLFTSMWPYIQEYLLAQEVGKSVSTSEATFLSCKKAELSNPSGGKMEGKMEQDRLGRVQQWYKCKESVKSEGEDLNLLVNLRTDPYLWSWALGSDQNMRWWIQAGKIGFLLTVSGFGLKERVRSSEKSCCMVRGDTWGVSDILIWQETRGKTQDTQERLHLSAGLGAPWQTLRGIGPRHGLKYSQT